MLATSAGAALSILGVDGLRNQYCAAADSLTVKPPWTDNGVRRGCTIEHGLPAGGFFVMPVQPVITNFLCL